MPGVVAMLKREVTILAEDPARREIFVVIDNYDDFSEENEAKHELVRDMSGLARRYGRDGLHFIIAGNLDGMVDDLAKRVQARGLRRGLAHRGGAGKSERAAPAGRP